MHNQTLTNTYLSRNELAEFLGISARTLDRWHAQRRGPKRVQVGNFIRYRQSDVSAWLDSNAVG